MVGIYRQSQTYVLTESLRHRGDGIARGVLYHLSATHESFLTDAPISIFVTIHQHCPRSGSLDHPIQEGNEQGVEGLSTHPHRMRIGDGQFVGPSHKNHRAGELPVDGPDELPASLLDLVTVFLK